MKNGAVILLSFLVLTVASAAVSRSEESLTTSRFGEIRIQGNKQEAQAFVMLLSDLSGWDSDDEKIASLFVAQKALVAGIDTAKYLNELADSDEECHYLAGEFERLAQVVQQNIGMQQFFRPLIAGYRGGASLVYAIMAEGPRSIEAGLSIGFCPSVKLDRSLCEEDEKIAEPIDPKGVVRFLPLKKLESPWYVLQLKDESGCQGNTAEWFVSAISNAEYSKSDAAGTTVESIVRKFTALAPKPRTPSDLSTDDLPLIDVHAQRKEKDYFAVLISGDGGWASIDKEIGEYLSDRGVSVVGVDALRYFWKKKTPEEGGRDLERIIKDYLEEWHKDRVVLIGYSLGADVLPVMINEMSPEARARVIKVVLLNAAKTTDLQVHLTDWVGIDASGDGMPLLPELKRIGAEKLYCIYGLDDDETICKDLKPDIMKVQGLPGSHHFDGDYEKVGELILKEIK